MYIFREHNEESQYESDWIIVVIAEKQKKQNQYSFVLQQVVVRGWVYTVLHAWHHMRASIPNSYNNKRQGDQMQYLGIVNIPA